MEKFQSAVMNHPMTANQPTVNNVHLFMGRFILDCAFRSQVEDSHFDLSFVVSLYPQATPLERKSLERILGILGKQQSEAGFYVIVPQEDKLLAARLPCGHPPCIG